jgi:hypothetical protein
MKNNSESPAEIRNAGIKTGLSNSVILYEHKVVEYGKTHKGDDNLATSKHLIDVIAVLCLWPSGLLHRVQQ